MKRVLLALFFVVAYAAQAVAQFADQATFAGTSAGTANAQTITINNATALVDLTGVLIKFYPGSGLTNTGATTLAVSGLTATAIFKPSATGVVALTGGELQAFQIVTIVYDGTRFVLTSPSATIGTASSIGPSSQAFTVPTNLGFNVVSSSNQLGINLITTAGANPSAAAPVLFEFRSATLATGQATTISLQNSLLFTLATTSSMGCLTAINCRLWILATDTNGTGAGIALCAINLVGGTLSLSYINETGLTNSAAGTSGGTNSGTTYCNVASIVARPYRILGYVEATWTSGTGWGSPTIVQLFGPGVPRPGTVVQSAQFSTTTSANFTNGTLANSSQQQVIVPSSSANLVRVTMASSVGTVGSAATVQVALYRSGTALPGANTSFSAPAAQSSPVSMVYLDRPSTASSITYQIFIAITGGTSVNMPTNSPAGVGTVLIVDEIQGALPEPANDDGSHGNREAA